MTTPKDLSGTLSRRVGRPPRLDGGAGHRGGPRLPGGGTDATPRERRDGHAHGSYRPRPDGGVRDQTAPGGDKTPPPGGGAGPTRRAEVRGAERRGPKPRHKVALTAPEHRELQRWPGVAPPRMRQWCGRRFCCWPMSTRTGATRPLPEPWAAPIGRCGNGGGAAGRGRSCRTPPGPGDHAFFPPRCGRRSPHWPARSLGIPVSRSPAGRPPNSPARSSSAASSGASPAPPSSAGSRPIASSRGATTAGSAPPTRASSNGPSRFWPSTNAPSGSPGRATSSSARTRRPRSRPGRPAG